eukprot:m.12941 g.12941  ORF g.12941 m.12941 type:complete len:59 (+) comp3268_c0_seq1:3946-4122(+)
MPLAILKPLATVCTRGAGGEINYRQHAESAGSILARTRQSAPCSESVHTKASVQPICR